jgi:nucleoid-associated protein YgaU
VAARRGIGGSARLLAFTNLVTVGPVRSLVDAAVGVSLLASATHAVAAPATVADPPAVVRTVDAPAGWVGTDSWAGTVQADTILVEAAPVAWSDTGASAAADPTCPADASHARVYMVAEGDSLWRIAERELGDATVGRRSSPLTKDVG